MPRRTCGIYIGFTARHDGRVFMLRIVPLGNRRQRIWVDNTRWLQLKLGDRAYYVNLIGQWSKHALSLGSASQWRPSAVVWKHVADGY
jgi:hypothetical protein